VASHENLHNNNISKITQFQPFDNIPHVVSILSDDPLVSKNISLPKKGRTK